MTDKKRTFYTHKRVFVAVLLVSNLDINVAMSYENFSEFGIGPASFKPDLNIEITESTSGSYFVDPLAGSDENIGSIDKPWSSLSHSISQLEPGNTLFLREGVYNESQITVSVSGKPDSPISIVAYPGETVAINGSLSNFREPFNAQWELVDKSIQLYKSKQDVEEGKLYLATLNYRGTNERLVTYYDEPRKKATGYDDLVASTMIVGKQPTYAGPGIYNSKGVLYLRLTPPTIPDDIRASVFSTSIDSSDITLSLSAQDSVFSVSGSYLTFKDIAVFGAHKGFRLRSGSGNLVFSDIKLGSVAIGFRADDSAVNVLLDAVTIDGEFPSWLAWSDMKGSSDHAKPASHWLMRSGGFSARYIENLTVRNSRFFNVFDGLVVGGKNIRIHNNLFTSRDDMVQLASSASNVWINHNVVYGAGPSHNGKLDSEFPGTKYIHHNVIDGRAVVLWSREDPQGLMNRNLRGVKSTIPFPRHNSKGIGKGDPWKIYNNTVLYNTTDFTTHPGYQLWGQVNDTDAAHEVYNNIFLDKGEGSFTRGVSTLQLNQRYDGNVYWSQQSKKDLVLHQRMETLGAKANFKLSEYWEFAVANKQSMPLYWDQSSKVIDPEFDANLIPQSLIKQRLFGVPLPKHWQNANKRFIGAVDSDR